MNQVSLQAVWAEIKIKPSFSHLNHSHHPWFVCDNQKPKTMQKM